MDEYFSKVSSSLVHLVQNKRADTLYFTCLEEQGNDELSAHIHWLDIIREAVGYSAENEDHYLPSLDALEFHWKRVCWVGQVWRQASKNLINFKSVLNHGWEVNDSNDLAVVWDSDRNFLKCDKLIRLWTKGCRCRKGCQKNCGCKRGGHPCGPGCLCVGTCANAPSDPRISQLKSLLV